MILRFRYFWQRPETLSQKTKYKNLRHTLRKARDLAKSRHYKKRPDADTFVNIQTHSETNSNNLARY